MKIKIGEKVYLQKYDVAYILENLSNFPDSLFEDIFESNDDDCFYIIDFADSLQFDYLLEETSNVEWIMNQDWIIDYDAFIKNSIPKLKAQANTLTTECTNGINEFNAKSLPYKKKYYEAESIKYNNLQHKIVSIHYLVDFLEGKIDFGFPEEYQDKTTTTKIINISSQHNTPNLSDTARATKKKTKPDFFAWLFGHSAR